MEDNNLKLKTSEDDQSVGYLYLPIAIAKERKVEKTIAIYDLVPGYKGIPVYLDFNEENELIGIEIVG